MPHALLWLNLFKDYFAQFYIGSLYAEFVEFVLNYENTTVADHIFDK